MASIDLLEELKLHDYYQQRLSFSEAIKLRGQSQNGCPKQYGLEIVRKLLMFDSTAVVSVTSEINKLLNNKDNKETETKCVSDDVRPPWRSDNAEQNERKLHPMDLLVVVMNCCDDLLRQVLVDKMFANKLSIPILLPDMKNGSYTLLLFALRSLVTEVQDRIQESSDSSSDAIVDVRNSVLSFIRVGDLHRSKSKLVNDLLSFNSFNTFFHRECPNGSVKRLVSNGSIEAAWFQSSTATKEEFNCRFFTALNLRGDSRDYPKQTQFLCQSSTLVVFMVDSIESFKELYENVLNDVEMSLTNIIVCNISPESPDKDDDKCYKFLLDLKDRGVISAVKYDWHNRTKKMSDNEFTSALWKTISELYKVKHLDSDHLSTYTNIVLRGKNIGFSHDEDNSKCETGKSSADHFMDLVLKLPPECKPLILPLQSNPWETIGKLEREQRGNWKNKNHDEYFIAEKETEKRRQREIQCISLIQQNDATVNFFLKMYLLQDETLWYYLNCCKMKLDSRSRVFISNITEEYKKEKQENYSTTGINRQLSNEVQTDVKLGITELKIENSTIGLENILRELGQMYEAVISEEIRMKEELKKAPLTPDVIRNFPSIVARLLLKDQPLELMDGDASNVPITWLKAVLDQIRIMTSNAKVFVLSIIGVQSSGKSTLLNALFGLQFPVSAGRCTKGIYCHLVPVDKECLHVECDYVLVVDTEGLGASQFTGSSTFRDNELATFAIGLADATIINMKGENWSEMKDILQIVAYGLIRVRKTKAELELMPRCMFVHQNVPAADAERKNRLGQDKQLALLDTAIKTAANEEGFTEIIKFSQVIWFDPDLHSWYFPDLWNGSPPKARISQDYIVKTNELRQYLMELMKDNPSKLTISSFFLRMSDLWNAMLHNDFVLCFRNTQEIILGTVLNDRISHEMDKLKIPNKVERTKFSELICSFASADELSADKERILSSLRAAVEKNFTNVTATLQEVINASDICAALKLKYVNSLNALKVEELRRIEDETTKVISVHMKKLEYGSDQRVKGLKAEMDVLEKCIEEVEKDKLNETGMKDYEERWQFLIAENKTLVDSRVNSAKEKIKNSIRRFASELFHVEIVKNLEFEELFKSPLGAEMPQVTGNDIVQNKHLITRFAMDLVYSRSYVSTDNSKLRDAFKRAEVQLQNLRDIEFDADYLRLVMLEVGQLLLILAEEHSEVRPGKDDIRSVLPPGYAFSRDYTARFCEFACHYIYNKSLENIKIFISLTDPLADIGERYLRSISVFRLKTTNENISAISEQIFAFSKRDFAIDLGDLIKNEVCKEDQKNPLFKTKRAFLGTILTDLGEKQNGLTNVNKEEGSEKKKIFEDFMLYVDLAESEISKDFFLEAILKLLKEMLAKESASQTDFQKMVEHNVGSIFSKAKNALTQAETGCKGCAREYVRIFKEHMNVTSEIDFRINTLDGFTVAVQQKIDTLYATFISQANASFETLVCVDNKAAIRPLFEKIMGCREKCPFCSAPCSQSLQHHAGDHRANHYPTGVSGTVDIKGLFTNTKETYDTNQGKDRYPEKLAIDTCQTMVGNDEDIRTKATVQKYNKWYHRRFKWNYHSSKNYKDVASYENWDIPYSQDHKTSLYWKWFMAQFDKELAEHYKALCPEIPLAWRGVTWDEARKSLDEPDAYSQFIVEE